MKFSLLRLGPLRFLLLLSLLLAAGLAWLWFDEHAQVRSLAWVAPKALAPDLKVPASMPQPGASASNQAAYAAILERPVFAPDRRPPPPPPPPTPPPPPDPLADIQIRGIFSGASVGILARVDGKLRRIKIDENIGPWTLKSIDGRDVTFTQGEQSRQLRLAYARLDTVAAPVVAPPVAKATVDPPNASPNAPPLAPSPTSLDQKAQEEVRDRIRRINQLRASRGIRPLTE